MSRSVPYYLEFVWELVCAVPKGFEIDRVEDPPCTGAFAGGIPEVYEDPSFMAGLVDRT